MNILLTGGTGLIGRSLTAELINAGHRITIFSRRADARVEGAQTVPWDYAQPETWAAQLESADAVIHLAGENLAGSGFLPARWTAERKRRIVESRVQSGQALAEAIRQAAHKPAVFIQASAIGYYGPRGDELITEGCEPGDDFLAQTCVRWEASTESVESLGVRRVVIRTGIVLTPEGGALARLLPAYRAYLGGAFGDGTQWYSWIHRADEVAAIRFLLENPQASGAFNLTAPNPLRNRDFGKTLGAVLNRPSWLPAPGFALRAALGEAASVVLEGQRVLPARLQELGFAFRFPELVPALRDLLTTTP